MNYHLPLALFLWLFTLPEIAQSAAWLQEKGKTQYISEFSYYYSNHFYDDNGDSQPGSAFAKIENSRLIEVGFDDNLTLGTQLRLAYNEADDGAVYDQYLNGNARLRDFSHGSASVDVFYRQALYQQEGWTVSFQPLFTFPESYTFNGENYYIDQHSYAMEIRGLVGYAYQHDNKPIAADQHYLPKPIAKQWHFANAEIAYRKKGKYTPAVQDEVKIDTTIGLRLHDNWLMLLQNFTTIGAEKLDQMAEFGYSKAQLTTVYRHTDGRGLQLSYFEDIWGRKSGKGKGFIIGVWSGF